MSHIFMTDVGRLSQRDVVRPSNLMSPMTAEHRQLTLKIAPLLSPASIQRYLRTVGMSRKMPLTQV